MQAPEPIAQAAELVSVSTSDSKIPVAPPDPAPPYEPYASDKALALLEAHLPTELPDVAQSDASSSSNGAHPPAEQVPTPALHDVMHPTRDVPRDVIL